MPPRHPVPDVAAALDQALDQFTVAAEAAATAASAFDRTEAALERLGVALHTVAVQMSAGDDAMQRAADEMGA